MWQLLVFLLSDSVVNAKTHNTKVKCSETLFNDLKYRNKQYNLQSDHIRNDLIVMLHSALKIAINSMTLFIGIDLKSFENTEIHTDDTLIRLQRADTFSVTP